MQLFIVLLSISILNAKQIEHDDTFQEQLLRSENDLPDGNTSVLVNGQFGNTVDEIAKIRTSRGPLRQMFPIFEEQTSITPQNSGRISRPK